MQHHRLIQIIGQDYLTDVILRDGSMSPYQERKVLLVTVAVLIGVIVAMIAGILSHLSGNKLAVAVTHGGMAFGGAVTLALLVINALTAP